MSLQWWGDKESPEREELKKMAQKMIEDNLILVVPLLPRRRTLSSLPVPFLDGRYTAILHIIRDAPWF